MGQRGVKGESRLEAPIALPRTVFKRVRGDGIGSPPAGAPARVDHAAPADREGPPEERVSISGESAEARGDLEPHVRRDILGPAARHRDLQIAKQARMNVTPDRGDGPFLAQASRGQDAGEGGLCHIAHVVPHRAIGS